MNPDDRPAVEIAVAVAVRAGLVLVARRGPGSHLGGFWEFPGGKISEGEDPAAAALRELREETGLSGGSAEPLVLVVHAYPDRSVRLHAFLVREPAGEVVVDGGRDWRWVEPPALGALEMPEANGPILRAVAWRLR
ncbi:MAG: (deoxy)nucleoside triphosphate pyrophosphohydrolase [Acidobacteriia bacterium]|nr:(deoxy)nucleoside triphosphate pyrophosphohydrolase [Terriglobia bacterium]